MTNDYYSRKDNSKDDWETPPYFFKLLDDIFHFTLDPCATDKNHKCAQYYTKEENGLLMNWGTERVFVNPPFSNIKEWTKKCYNEGRYSPNTIVVMIIPSRTDTKYWHDYIMRANEIWFCKKRVNFLRNGIKPKAGATFPLAIVIFKSINNLYTPTIKSFEHR